jgi:hypothetical protein
VIGPGVIPYMSHGIGVDESLFSGEPSLAQTGSPPRRVSVPGAQGLTGDSALTRYPAPDRAPTVTASAGDDDNVWTSFGLGAAMGALVAAVLAAVVLAVRHRGRVALP